MKFMPSALAMVLDRTTAGGVEEIELIDIADRRTASASLDSLTGWITASWRPSGVQAEPPPPVGKRLGRDPRGGSEPSALTIR